MTKRIISAVLVVLLIIVLILPLCACNKQLIDTTFKFDRAVISLPNGEVIEGDIQSWKDYEDGDQIQVKIDGKVYLVYSSNIALISE
jgi:hypothetical protein